MFVQPDRSVYIRRLSYDLSDVRWIISDHFLNILLNCKRSFLLAKWLNRPDSFTALPVPQIHWSGAFAISTQECVILRCLHLNINLRNGDLSRAYNHRCTLRTSWNQTILHWTDHWKTNQWLLDCNPRPSSSESTPYYLLDSHTQQTCA